MRELVPGSGRLVFMRHGGRTVLHERVARSPLQLMAPRNHGPAAWVLCASHGGGLVGGDHIELEARIAEGAWALIGTQAATKVYAATGGPCVQRTAAEVGAGGLLVHLPEPVIPFAGSRCSQVVEVRLAEGASLVHCEGLVAGRLGRGERWQMAKWRARTVVTVAGRVVLRESVLLDAGAGELGWRMGRCSALGLIVLWGPLVAEVAGRLKERIAETGIGGGVWITAGGLPAGGGEGALVRIGGEDAETVAAAGRACLGFLPGMLGDDPFRGRGWQSFTEGAVLV